MEFLKKIYEMAALKEDEWMKKDIIELLRTKKLKLKGMTFYFRNIYLFFIINHGLTKGLFKLFFAKFLT